MVPSGETVRPGTGGITPTTCSSLDAFWIDSAMAAAYWGEASVPVGARKTIWLLVEPAASGKSACRRSMAAWDWAPGTLKLSLNSPPAATLAAPMPIAIASQIRIVRPGCRAAARPRRASRSVIRELFHLPVVGKCLRWLSVATIDLACLSYQIQAEDDEEDRPMRGVRLDPHGQFVEDVDVRPRGQQVVIVQLVVGDDDEADQEDHLEHAGDGLHDGIDLALHALDPDRSTA